MKSPAKSPTKKSFSGATSKSVPVKPALVNKTTSTVIKLGVQAYKTLSHHPVKLVMK